MTQQCFAQNADIRLLRKIHSNSPRTADGTMKLFTRTSYGISFCLPVGEIAYGLAENDKTVLYKGFESLAAIGINTVATYGIKHIINRSRPYTDYPDIIPDEYENGRSMPSGHTSVAFAAATAVSLQFPKWYIIAPAYLWAGAVGYSRLYLGTHYPSDVLAGALVGACSAVIAHKANQWLMKHKTKKPKLVD